MQHQSIKILKTKLYDSFPHQEFRSTTKNKYSKKDVTYVKPSRWALLKRWLVFRVITQYRKIKLVPFPWNVGIWSFNPEIICKYVETYLLKKIK